MGDGDVALVLGVGDGGLEGAVGGVVEGRAADEAVGQVGDALDDVGELGEGLFPAGAAALPLEEPGGGEGGELGAETDGDLVGLGLEAVAADLAVGVQVLEGLVDVQSLADDVAGALVAAGDVVEVWKGLEAADEY